MFPAGNHCRGKLLFAPSRLGENASYFCFWTAVSKQALHFVPSWLTNKGIKFSNQQWLSRQGLWASMSPFVTLLHDIHAKRQYRYCRMFTSTLKRQQVSKHSERSSRFRTKSRVSEEKVIMPGHTQGPTWSCKLTAHVLGFSCNGLAQIKSQV